MKKILIIIIVILLCLLLIVRMLRLGNNKPPVVESVTPTPTGKVTEETKLKPMENLCPQISKEFVVEVTGVAIERVSALNGPIINACDYYLTDDKNAPYIAIIVNKNLNFEKHKQIAINNHLVVKTEPTILGNHYIAWADGETRISYIDLKINENSFLRIDKNVERAIDNEGMIKLARAISYKL